MSVASMTRVSGGLLRRGVTWSRHSTTLLSPVRIKQDRSQRTYRCRSLLQQRLSFARTGQVRILLTIQGGGVQSRGGLRAWLALRMLSTIGTSTFCQRSLYWLDIFGIVGIDRWLGIIGH